MASNGHWCIILYLIFKGISDGLGPDSISASGSPKKGGMGSSIGGVISQLFDDITTKPGNGFVVNIRLDVERKNCYGQHESNVAASGPVNNSRCDTFSDGAMTTSKIDSSDVTSLSNLELCTLLEERLITLTDLRHDVRSNLLDNIRHVKHVLRNGL
ncbi:uncharacterized protein LOC121368053 [Gigantopelta aegis]|uniref:uncharacterized protein LOC121368053 n=1 Tax=Gigantopelta aegis TaxID=1735272 RepID=UPI001B88E30F|nr:uncharacterized protein LOC121368053 [Gigantopelta aegis]